MNVLALDIGTRRTGVAFMDVHTGVPVAVGTIHHASEDELITQVFAIVRERDCSSCVVGLPLLPDGTEGAQVAIVNRIAEQMEDNGLAVSFIDERYTTQDIPGVDGDAAAACVLLNLYVERRKSI